MTLESKSFDIILIPEVLNNVVVHILNFKELYGQQRFFVFWDILVQISA
jgi:hypothetical protein